MPHLALVDVAAPDVEADGALQGLTELREVHTEREESGGCARGGLKYSRLPGSGHTAVQLPTFSD